MECNLSYQVMDGKPLLFEIKGNSLDDGPGIRTVIFFKGCPLSCVWCHNPEGIKSAGEISFDRKECIGCKTCLDICEEKALNQEHPDYIDRNKCSLCYKCVESCPAGALAKVGRYVEIREIMEAVKKDIPFFKNSGGGVTLTGGECTLFMDFTSNLLKELKKNHIHTLIETCGHFNSNKFIDLILPYTDIIYFDIKLMDERLHKKYCGVTNKTILKNFVKLNDHSINGDVVLLPRIPLIPGITDMEENLKNIASFLLENNADRAELLPYHPLWIEKNNNLGNPNLFSEKEWMSKEKIKACENIFLKMGIKV